MVYLGLDEIGELHENLDQTITLIIPNIESIFDKFFFSNGYVSSPWILYNLLAIIILSPIIIWIFYTSIKLYQKRNIYLLTTFLCFALVILLEYISTSWVHPIIYNILIVIEEFIEMFGISLLSVFVSIETSQRYTQIKNKLK
ncbi:hypothetical protein HC766_07725 [Candidatus Gracilibacteria bacterium]|nr:hypothetical protein [Candidatus Gracilibacteria bacterium]